MFIFITAVVLAGSSAERVCLCACLCACVCVCVKLIHMVIHFAVRYHPIRWHYPIDFFSVSLYRIHTVYLFFISISNRITCSTRNTHFPFVFCEHVCIGVDMFLLFAIQPSFWNCPIGLNSIIEYIALKGWEEEKKNWSVTTIILTSCVDVCLRMRVCVSVVSVRYSFISWFCSMLKATGAYGLQFFFVLFSFFCWFDCCVSFTILTWYVGGYPKYCVFVQFLCICASNFNYAYIYFDKISVYSCSLSVFVSIILNSFFVVFFSLLLLWIVQNHCSVQCAHDVNEKVRVKQKEMVF